MQWSAGCRVAIPALLVAVLGMPRSAEAQFNKLKKAVTEKAVEGVGGSCFAGRRPTMVASLPLSAAEIAQVSAGLDAEMAAAPGIEKKAADDQKKADAEQKAYDKAKADYDKAHEKYSKCREKVQTADAATAEGMNARTEQATDPLKNLDTTKMMALAQKAQAASQRISEGKGTAEDRKTLAEFQAMMSPIQAQGMAAGASMQEASAFQQGAGARVEKACGKEPQAPKEPGSATSPEGQLLNAGAKGAKMDAQDYMVARELVIQWASSNTVVGSGGEKGNADAQNKALQDAAGKVCAMRKANLPT